MSSEKFNNQNNINENKEQILKQNIYELTKEDKSYKIEICEKNDKILISYLNYEIQLNPDEISKIFKINLKTIEEAYDHIINIFKENKVIIKDLIIDEKMKLLLKYSDNKNEQKKIEIDLINIKQNKDYLLIDIINKYNNLEQEVIYLKKQFLILKDKVMKSKAHKDNNKKYAEEKHPEANKSDKNIHRYKEHNNDEKLLDNKNNINNLDNDKNKIKSNSNENEILNNDENENENIIELKFLNEITTNSFCSNIEDNTFCIFNSFNDNILYLIYSTKEKSIISYNINEKKIFKEIKDSHEGEYITNFHHCIFNNKDIIMSISLSNNMLKIWEFPIFSCILTLKNINSNGNLYSACFLNNDNSNIIERYNYIITSCAGSNEQIKIFDFDGNIIKKFEQKDSDDVYFIDSYFDLKLKK